MSSRELTKFSRLDVSDPENQPAHITEHATKAAPAHRGTYDRVVLAVRRRHHRPVSPLGNADPSR
jgi:hypothetical protein